MIADLPAFRSHEACVLTDRLAQKDASVEEHAQRVAVLVVLLGERMALPSSQIRELEMAGRLHDIGKLGVPDFILKSPSKLTDEEFAVIRCHPELGCRLLGAIAGFPRSVRRMVRDHHERLDGAGYPRGLSGGEINLATRILTVCDVYDALVSPRVYRAAWGEDDAMAQLRKEAGAAFDPGCLVVLEDVLRHSSGELR